MSEIGLRRRNFFRSLAREAAVRADEMRGIPQMRLDQLDQLPDEVLAELVPGVAPGVQILPDDDFVRGRIPGVAEPVVLFRHAPAELYVFNRFNGRNRLGQVAEEWAAETASEYSRAFGFTRAIFLGLVRLRACVPMNNP